MKPAERADFGALMTQALAFYRQDASDFALSVWWEACKSFDLEQVRKALTAHAMDPERGQFAPKPADLVRQLQGTHTDRAQLAWHRVLKAIQVVGAYGDANFHDPAIHAAISDLGGWAAVCRAPSDELQFWQRRFSDAYRVYSQRGVTDAPLVLAGEHSLENAAKGKIPATAAPSLASPEAERLRVTLQETMQ